MGDLPPCTVRAGQGPAALPARRVRMGRLSRRRWFLAEGVPLVSAAFPLRGAPSPPFGAQADSLEHSGGKTS